MSLSKLLGEPPEVVNVGIEAFAQSLDLQGAKVLHVDWAPPQELDPETERLLDRLL